MGGVIGAVLGEHRASLGVDSGVFDAQVARAPEAVAVTFDGRSLTYRELDEASNRLAHLLAAKGCGPGQCGAAVLPVTEAIVAIMAVLKTGAAYRADRPGAARGADRVRARRRHANRRDDHGRAGRG